MFDNPAEEDSSDHTQKRIVIVSQSNLQEDYVTYLKTTMVITDRERTRMSVAIFALYYMVSRFFDPFMSDQCLHVRKVLPTRLGASFELTKSSLRQASKDCHPDRNSNCDQSLLSAAITGIKNARCGIFDFLAYHLGISPGNVFNVIMIIGILIIMYFVVEETYIRLDSLKIFIVERINKLGFLPSNKASSQIHTPTSNLDNMIDDAPSIAAPAMTTYAPGKESEEEIDENSRYQILEIENAKVEGSTPKSGKNEFKRRRDPSLGRYKTKQRGSSGPRKTNATNVMKAVALGSFLLPCAYGLRNGGEHVHKYYLDTGLVHGDSNYGVPPCAPGICGKRFARCIQSGWFSDTAYNYARDEKENNVCRYVASEVPKGAVDGYVNTAWWIRLGYVFVNAMKDGPDPWDLFCLFNLWKISYLHAEQMLEEEYVKEIAKQYGWAELPAPPRRMWENKVKYLASYGFPESDHEERSNATKEWENGSEL